MKISRETVVKVTKRIAFNIASKKMSKKNIRVRIQNLNTADLSLRKILIDNKALFLLRRILKQVWRIDHDMSSLCIIWNTFSISLVNSSLEILLSPFSSISSRMSSTSSRVGLSTPIYLAICTRTCQNSPRSRQPLPSISTLLNASSINFFIFLASFIKLSNFLPAILSCIDNKKQHNVIKQCGNKGEQNRFNLNRSQDASIVLLYDFFDISEEFLFVLVHQFLIESQLLYFLSLFLSIIQPFLDCLHRVLVSFDHPIPQSVNVRLWRLDEDVCGIRIYFLDLLPCHQVHIEQAYLSHLHHSLNLDIRGSIIVAVYFSMFQERLRIFLEILIKLESGNKEVINSLHFSIPNWSSSIAHTQLEKLGILTQEMVNEGILANSRTPANNQRHINSLLFLHLY